MGGFFGAATRKSAFAPARALGAPDQPSQQGNQEQNKKNEKQNLCDSCGRESNASETENRGDNRDYEKS